MSACTSPCASTSADCQACRREGEEIETLGRAVRQSAPARRRARRDDLASVRNGVVGRFQAERAYTSRTASSG